MPQLKQDYVFLPQRLITDLQANPAAIGVYALIARLFLIYQEPIPLSAADLQRYDPSLSYGAARGALQRLTALHWLTDQSGHKNQYTPTWGVIKGVASPWRMDAPTLGRPAHVATLRLDRRLLDIGLGKLIPHPTYRAQTNERYLEQPILSLRDVGTYAQMLSGQALAATPALWRYELVRDGSIQPLPDPAELIALASQRTLEGDGAAPTAQGRRVLGLGSPQAPATPSRQPLFFVDHALIPDPITCSIPDLIPPAGTTETLASAAECSESRQATRSQRMAGNPGILRDTSESPPQPPIHRHGGGGRDQNPNKEMNLEATQLETEAARLLRTINAFPSSIEELAEMPAELVARAILYAESEPGIESIPGWVVEALRRHRDEGWPLPTPRTRHNDRGGRDEPIDIETYTNGAYGDLFRLGSDMRGLEDWGSDQCADVPALSLEDTHEHEDTFADRDVAVTETRAPDDCLSPVSADDTLTRQIQAELKLRCSRQRGRVIDGLQIHVAATTSLVICATHADMEIVQRELIGALHRILGSLGAPVQLVFTTRAGWEAEHRNTGNARNRPHLSSHHQSRRHDGVCPNLNAEAAGWKQQPG